jgi:hypothetical protein
MKEIENNDSFYQAVNFDSGVYVRKDSGWLKFLRSMGKHFIVALGFKIIYKLTRNIDKIGLNNLTTSRIGEIILNPANLQYPLFFVMIRLFYKLFMWVINKYFDITSNQHKYLLRILSMLFGKFTSFLVILMGKNSNVVFYTVLVVLLRSLFYFVFYNSERQMMNQNKLMVKHMYYLGVGLGFVNLTVAFGAFREKIKLVKFLGTNFVSPVVRCLKSFK